MAFLVCNAQMLYYLILEDRLYPQERDFYFSKLREIELLCQQEGIKEAWDVMQHVENILYAATEEEGTQARLSALDALNVATAADSAA